MINQILKQIKYRFFDYSEKKHNVVHSSVDHIKLSLNWFKNSLSPDGGVTAKYNMLTHDFTAAYPKSTAMWVPVLFRVQNYYPEIFKSVMDDDINKELVNWLLRTQRRDGTFPAGYGNFMNQPPSVFNNGIIIHGLLDYYNACGGTDLLQACINSADWLLKVQSPDGSWRQFTNHQLSSNTLTAAALIRLSNITGVEAYKNAGIRNLNFALELQLTNGYFKGNGVNSDYSSFNITMAFAIAGLLEASILEGNIEWRVAAMKAIVPMLNKVEQNGFLVGEFDEEFGSSASYACLPGSCLIAICAFKLASLTGDDDLRSKANLIVDYVKSKQLESKSGIISGGITGSFPISGNYCSYEITSWGVRYFIEALMLQDANQ